MKRIPRTIRIILLVLFVGPVAIFIFGSIVMWLWNNALVPVLHISEVTFWQALGILVLSKILFGSFRGGRSRRDYPSWKERIKQKWDRMTPEEKEKFKEKWKDRWWRGYKPWDSESSAGQVDPGS